MNNSYLLYMKPFCFIKFKEKMTKISDFHVGNHDQLSVNYENKYDVVFG